MFCMEKGRKEGVEPSFLGPQPSVLTIGLQPSFENNLRFFSIFPLGTERRFLIASEEIAQVLDTLIKNSIKTFLLKS